MHDSVDIAIVWGDDESEGCFALYGAVNKFGVSHDFVVEEWDFFVVCYVMVSDRILECETARKLNKGIDG